MSVRNCSKMRKHCEETQTTSRHSAETHTSKLIFYFISVKTVLVLVHDPVETEDRALKTTFYLFLRRFYFIFYIRLFPLKLLIPIFDRMRLIWSICCLTNWNSFFPFLFFILFLRLGFCPMFHETLWHDLFQSRSIFAVNRCFDIYCWVSGRNSLNLCWWIFTNVIFLFWDWNPNWFILDFMNYIVFYSLQYATDVYFYLFIFVCWSNKMLLK